MVPPLPENPSKTVIPKEAPRPARPCEILLRRLRNLLARAGTQRSRQPLARAPFVTAAQQRSDVPCTGRHLLIALRMSGSPSISWTGQLLSPLPKKLPWAPAARRLPYPHHASRQAHATGLHQCRPLAPVAKADEFVAPTRNPLARLGPSRVSAARAAVVQARARSARASRASSRRRIRAGLPACCSRNARSRASVSFARPSRTARSRRSRSSEMASS
jgi:hypothetical protein